MEATTGFRDSPGKNKVYLSTKIGLWLGFISLLSAILSGIAYFYFFNQAELVRQKNALVLTNVDFSSHLNGILIEKIRVIQTLVAAETILTSVENSNSAYERIPLPLRLETITGENNDWITSQSNEDAVVSSRLDSPSAKILDLHMANNPGIYGEIFVTNKFGVVVGSSRKLSTLAHRHKYWWQAAYAEGRGKIFLDDRGFDPSVGGVVLGLVVPIKAGGEIIGMIKANLNMGELFRNFIDFDKKGRDFNIGLYRSRGRVIHDRNQESASMAPPELANLIKNRNPHGIVSRLNFLNQIRTVAPIALTLGNPDIGFGGQADTEDRDQGNNGEFWVIALSQNWPLLDWTRPEFQGFLLFFFLILTLIPALGMWVVSKSVEPLRALTAEINDFDIDKPYLVDRNYPTQGIQELATAFHRLGNRLKETLVSRDELIDEMKQRAGIEAELREQKWRFNSMTDSSPDAIVAINSDGEVISWNKGAESIFGYTEAELLGKSLSLIIPERYLRAHNAALERLRNDRNEKIDVHSAEYAGLRKDGSEFPIELIIGSWRGYRQTFYSGFIRDITERKKTEAMLLENLNFTEQIVAESPVGLATYDSTGQCQSMNHAFLATIGASMGQVPGKNFHDIQSWQESGLYSAAQQAIRENITVHHALRVKSSLGKSLAVDCALVPFISKGEAHLLLVANDISKQLKMEKALRQSQKMDAVGQLTGGIAHDFNNMLGVIMGNLDLLRRKVSGDPKALEYVEAAYSGSKRGADITRKLLRFSRHDAGHPQLTNVNAFIEAMRDLISRSITPKISIDTRLSAELWSVNIDPGDFEDALVNLSLNARDAMPKGGTLVIETANKLPDDFVTELNPESTDAKYVMISVSDTGIGMTGEEIDKAFQPFFTTKEPGQGTGLGLSMVYGFVQRSGGLIKIYSEPGKGTTVRLYLPKAGQSIDPLDLVSVDSNAELPDGNETVLIVDDEEGLRRVAVDLLENLGYQTLTADSALQAMKLLRENPQIDLLFSDVVMPGAMDGYELAKAALGDNPGLKILLASGFSARCESDDVDDLMLYAKLSASLLNKPYNHTELARAIRRALDEEESDWKVPV